MKYIHIIKFLLNHDLTHLKDCWLTELTGGNKLSVYRIVKSYLKTRSLQKKYLFWWRLSNEMYMYGNKKQRNIAKNIQPKLISQFGIDIMFGADIGKNISLVHAFGIAINKNVFIGENLTIHQNVTIGQGRNPVKIVIGDNVFIGAGTIILGGEITIGNNVKIGAGAFINKDIPDNCTVYTKKNNTIIQNNS
ncbi:serine O-acetyltransferase [Gilliamella apicola]|uniref:serine O-acetyltransferase n=1 Tax=Gilliamella apicola TaxID=1196095 RepID=UPI000A343B11|nr:DapH/DapD/GlmU-related protein [Gilliamella apicola]OTQ27396.1 hypothetical protein B6D02_08675 [Gilliamella apicola]